MFNSSSVCGVQDAVWKLQSLKLQCFLPRSEEISTYNSGTKRWNEIRSVCWQMRLSCWEGLGQRFRPFCSKSGWAYLYQQLELISFQSRAESLDAFLGLAFCVVFSLNSKTSRETPFSFSSLLKMDAHSVSQLSFRCLLTPPFQEEASGVRFWFPCRSLMSRAGHQTAQMVLIPIATHSKETPLDTIFLLRGISRDFLLPPPTPA